MTTTTPTSGAADRANDEIDRLHALAAGQATAAQQGVAYAELDERAAFEAWLRSVWTAGYSCPKFDSGKYVHGDAQQFWECWQARAAQQPAPSPAETVGNSGFDYQTAADVLNGKTVSDEAIRKFVAASRWAHDDRAGLRATLLSVRGELASREAEILLLKNALMGAEGPQPSTTAQADTQPAPVLWVSPEQFANFVDTDEAEFGKYIPARKTSAGKFTMPLFAARAPADSVQEDAARYRWLTGDHHKHEVRAMVYEIATSMNVRGKGSVDAAIDAARKQGGPA